MIDTILNIITWSLITAGAMLFAIVIGLIFFVVVEKLSER